MSKVDGLEMIDYDFGHNFVDTIIEGYKLKVIEGFWIVHLQNESNKGGFECFIHVPRFAEILNNSKKVLPRMSNKAI